MDSAPANYPKAHLFGLEFFQTSKFVTQCYFTKFAEAYAFPDVRALTTADVLVTQFISRYGVPFIIHSDQGSAFESELFRNMADLFEISKSRTTPYHPRSDGLTERFNGTLQTKIKSIVDSSKCDDWEDYIPYLRIAYTVFS